MIVQLFDIGFQIFICLPLVHRNPALSLLLNFAVGLGSSCRTLFSFKRTYRPPLVAQTDYPSIKYCISNFIAFQSVFFQKHFFVFPFKKANPYFLKLHPPDLIYQI